MSTPGLAHQVERSGQNGMRIQKTLMATTLEPNETCWTSTEIAERLKLNRETVRRMFLNEPGVIVICCPRKGRRVYRTLRIPEHVFQRVLTRLVRVA